jgi:hypothetical protein
MEYLTDLDKTNCIINGAEFAGFRYSDECILIYSKHPDLF